MTVSHARGARPLPAGLAGSRTVRCMLRLFSAPVLLVLAAATLPFNAIADTGDTADGFWGVRVSVEGYPPRVVEVPDSVTSVVLLDAFGASIPLTGDGLTDLDGTKVVYIPRLAFGEYTLAWDGGSTELMVADALVLADGNFKLAGQSGNLIRVLPAFGALAVLAVLALQRRWKLAATLIPVAIIAGALGAVSGVGATDTEICLAEVGTNNAVPCMAAKVLESLERDGMRSAAAVLGGFIADPDSPLRAGCHEAAHVLGEAGWRHLNDIAAMVEVGTPNCQFGYFHGMLESMGSYLPGDILPSELLRACQLVVDYHGTVDGAYLPALCSHGAGHALMWRHNGDLDAALPGCQLFPSGNQRENCIAGVVMDWVTAGKQVAANGAGDEHLPSPRLANPLEFCSPPRGEPSPGCIEGALSGFGPAEVLDAAHWCAENKGEYPLPDISVVGPRGAYRDGVSGVWRCVLPLVKVVVYDTVKDALAIARSAPELCAALSPITNAETCGEVIGYVYFMTAFDRAGSEKLCSALPDQYTSGCRKGIASGEQFEGDLRSLGGLSRASY